MKEQTIEDQGWTLIDLETLIKLANGHYEYTELNIELDMSLAKEIA